MHREGGVEVVETVDRLLDVVVHPEDAGRDVLEPLGRRLHRRGVVERVVEALDVVGDVVEVAAERGRELLDARDLSRLRIRSRAA